MARRGYLPVAGVIENMSAFVCDHGTSYALFGSGGGERLAEQLKVPLLAQIPLHPDMAAGGDVGLPSAGGTGPLAHVFAELARKILEEIAPPVSIEGCSARMLDALEKAVAASN
jgi:ATP-binding protein involved in chromosome partitioning